MVRQSGCDQLGAQYTEPGRDSQRRVKSKVSAARRQQEVNARLEPFTAFWNGLAKTEQTEFEAAALKLTQPMKRDGYLRLLEIGGLVFEQYRRVILRDHFERTLRSQSNRDHSA